MKKESIYRFAITENGIKFENWYCKSFILHIEMSATATIKETSRHSHNWQNQPDVITANDVIDAYFKGKEDGKTEQERVYRSLFNSNLERAKLVSESLFEQIIESGLHLKSIHLKADTITSFCALFVADSNDFLKEGFRDVFLFARKAKVQNEDATFEISFLFTPDSKTLSEHSLASDGYFIKYYGEK